MVYEANETECKEWQAMCIAEQEFCIRERIKLLNIVGCTITRYQCIPQNAWQRHLIRNESGVTQQQRYSLATKGHKNLKLATVMEYMIFWMDPSIIMVPYKRTHEIFDCDPLFNKLQVSLKTTCKINKLYLQYFSHSFPIDK